MRMRIGILSCLVMLSLAANGVSKPHNVIFAKWRTVDISKAETNLKPDSVKVRTLSVDGHAKEFTTGPAHDVTERTFVVQRIYKMNDSLPQESGPSQWQWQKGGWLLVDRISGKIQQIALPGFNPDSSAVSWFRDYAAYCGTSDDGRKLLAMIVQLGQRKPLLRKIVSEDTKPETDATAQTCAEPLWERAPTRAIFDIGGQKITFAVKYRAAEAATEDEDSGSE